MTLVFTQIPQVDWASRAEGRGNVDVTADPFFHPSRRPGLDYLIQHKHLI